MKPRAFFAALLTAGSLLASQPLVAQTTASNPGLDEEAVLPGTQIKGEIWNAVEVLEDLLALPEDGIPPALLRNAHGLVVIPSMIKLGWMIGGRHGSGVMLVKKEDGSWSQPIFVSLTGASFGFQFGAQSSDVVLAFKKDKSIRNILEGKLTLGAETSVAAGPVGREASASTDAQLRAEIYSWSRARGLFAGVSLDGSILRVDDARNASFYQTPEVSPEQILAGSVTSRSGGINRLHALVNDPTNALGAQP
jgi:lipid-binding SYLF domain-containing protein